MEKYDAALTAALSLFYRQGATGFFSIGLFLGRNFTRLIAIFSINYSNLI